MKHLNHLPVWRDATRLLLEIEQAVREFPRYHKYSIGSTLRLRSRAGHAPTGAASYVGARPTRDQESRTGYAPTRYRALQQI